ncbi:ATP-dependent zinc protease family protein [Oceanospirillum linum]|uniref:Ribosomal protein S6 modification protein n=1 Tax=Oceanospirillum linum TaxID=966 RepID=A0A1T1HA13_OCELI|nr:RimK/LysX family protein [Oceanospirillum linum]OOV86704.1 ribosomal protein S6 modification protein [Oceanospirillum linum]SEG25651.1 Uncharacterized conserved protein [Oleiphilus messinensis]SMP27913.1 Uncharacterized conserved protein [Oceanospirillum linum]
MTENPIHKRTLGWREALSIPSLGVEEIIAKVDTGARTSAIHAFFVEPFKAADGRDWVRFGLHPLRQEQQPELVVEAPVKDRRQVSDSGGHSEERYVIETVLKIGDETLVAEVTLTDRETMAYRMLLGRTALRGRFIVDPDLSYACSAPQRHPNA